MSPVDQGGDGPTVGCPVCGRPAGSEPGCAECGWPLRSPLRAGPVTAQLRAGYTSRLHDAQQTLDARVVARITDDPLPYQHCIRGGVPGAAQWATARQSATRDSGDAGGEPALRAALADVVSGLGAGTQATVAEVSGDGITVSRTGVDRSGTPWLEEAFSRTWTVLLPMLSGRREEREFQLAGGLHGVDRGGLAERLRGGLAGLADIPAGEVLVICRPAAWMILEWAAAGLLAAWPQARLLRVAPPAGSIPVAAMLAGLTTEAPLRDAYQLMVAVVDDISGAVAIQPRQIFAPGDTPGTECRLRLLRPPGETDDTALAIFSSSAEPGGEPLALYSAKLSPERQFQLRVILDGPGRARITDPAVTDHPGAWHQIRDEIPDRVDVTVGPADLVCAIELAGPVPEVRARLRLVRTLLERVADDQVASAQLRVGVVTCTDHDFERGQEYRPVVKGVVVGPVQDALAWLARQTTATVSYPRAAPIEDLLYESSIMLADARATGRAARLLLVGGRRPHPYPQGTETVMRCPLQYKWQEILRQLTGEAGARCVAVTKAVAGNRGHAAIWEELGPAGLYWLPDTTAQVIGEDLGLLARQVQRIPIPLPDPE
jgi:hypothetical protein